MHVADRDFRIDTYPSKNSARPTPYTLPLADFYMLLEHEQVDCVLEDGSSGCRGKKCPQKDGLAWTAGFIDNVCSCGSSRVPGKGEKKGICPECKARIRFKENVVGLDFAVFDIDHISEQQRDEMLTHLDGVELYLHTTHNHLPPEDQNFRLIFPLARTITSDEWKQIRFAIMRKFQLPNDEKHGVDNSAKDPARLAFFPRSLRGRPFINVRQEGALLDPHGLLVENSQHSRQELLAPRERTPQRDPSSIDLNELRGFLRRYDPSDDAGEEKKALIQHVLNEESFATRGARGFTTLRVGSIIGKLLPLGIPFEAAFEIMRPAYSKIELFDDDNPDENSLDAWQNQAQRGYEQSQEEKENEAIERDDMSGKLIALARRKREAANPEITRARKRESLSLYVPPAPLVPLPESPVGPPPVHFPVPPEVPSDRDDDGDWRIEKLIMAPPDKQGRPHPKNTSANLCVVLENHRAWKGVLRYNELRNEPEAHGGPILESKREPKRLITAIRNWFAHQEELEMPRYEIVEAVEFVSLAHKYDPIREYLTALVWDGVPRIREWLIRYCKARLIDATGLDTSAYVRMVGEKWLMAGAARGLYPGCKADNVLVFEGNQYAGKSKTLDILGGEWFLDTRMNIGDKSALELTTQNWIIELAELASMKRSETETQKSFFSSRKDSLRLAYAHRAEKFPRRCIFAGTTNETEYLLDLTGNRRFWCVWCDEFDVVGIRQDRDQLWAEATAIVRAGESCPNCTSIEERCELHRWWLDKNQTALAETVATTRLKSEFADTIRAWWFLKDRPRPARLNTVTILKEALDLPIDKLESQRMSIGRAMKALGFQKNQIRAPGGREWVYEATPPLLNAPQWTLNPTKAQSKQFVENFTKSLKPPEAAI